MGITDTENIFFIFARNTPKNKHKIMILPFVSPVLLPLLLLSPGWLLLILSSKERLNHKEKEPETTVPTQDSSQGTHHLMLVSLELLQVLQVNISQISFSIPAETETTTGVKQTTESLVETLATSFLVLLLVLLGPPLLTIFLEILVEDKILFLLLILVFNLLKI